MAAFDKSLPKNTDAEKAILGGLILDQGANGLIAEVAAQLSPEEFFSRANAEVYRAILAIAEKNGNGCVDPITLIAATNDSVEVQKAGGPAYLADLFDGVPRFSNLDNYISLVKETATARALIHAGNAIMTTAFDNEMSISQQIDAARKVVQSIDDPSARETWDEIGAAAYTSLLKIEERIAQETLLEGPATGFATVDYIMGGLPTEMILLGARPGMGKTALGLAISERASFYPPNNNPLIPIFTLEMYTEQMTRRMLCGRAGVNVHRVRTGQLSGGELKRLANAAQELASRKIVIDDTPGLTPNMLRTKLRKLIDKYGQKPAFVVIDYIQYMRAEKAYTSRREEVGTISRGVKDIVKEFQVPILAMASLSRASETRADKKPTLSDLRETGDLESDAGVVLFIHRDAYYNQEARHDSDEYEKAELIIAKHRDGASGESIPLSFARKLARFGDWDEQMASQYQPQHAMDQEFA